MKVHLFSVIMVIVTVGFAVGDQPKENFHGVVRDPAGAVLAGAAIHVQRWRQDKAGWRPEVLTKPSTFSDRDGRFSFYLPPGLYDIFISHPIMRPFSEKIRIESDKETTLDCKLEFSPFIEMLH